MELKLQPYLEHSVGDKWKLKYDCSSGVSCCSCLEQIQYVGKLYNLLLLRRVRERNADIGRYQGFPICVLWCPQVLWSTPPGRKGKTCQWAVTPQCEPKISDKELGVAGRAAACEKHMLEKAPPPALALLPIFFGSGLAYQHGTEWLVELSDWWCHHVVQNASSPFISGFQCWRGGGPDQVSLECAGLYIMAFSGAYKYFL